MFKCCQYAINDSKFNVNLTSISIKETHAILQEIITWMRINVKGWKEWHKACEFARVHPPKLKILIIIHVASKVILFQKILNSSM
jgi:hypothetical protein